MIGCLFGCETNENDSHSNQKNSSQATTYQEETPNVSNQDKPEATASDDEGLTLEEAKASKHSYVFIKRGEKFYPTDAVALEDGDHLSYGWCATVGMTYCKEDDVPVLNIANGDELVFIVTKSEISDYSFYGEKHSFSKVTDTRYCFPIVFEEQNEYGLQFDGIYTKVQLIAPEEKYHNIETLNGFDVRQEQNLFDKIDGCYIWEVVDSHSGSNKFIASDVPTKLVAGYFDSTDWKEYNFCITAWTFHYPEKYDVPLSKTPNGYFTFDCTSLTDGYFAIAASSVFKHLINIKK